MELHSLKVFDTKIFFWIHGEGKPLLFIHGHRSDALRWRGVILFLGKKFKVYAPDLPGFGKSPPFKNKKHSMENYAFYLNEFVRILNLKDYHLFGGSMGGIIALNMVLLNPKIKPTKLVLVGTPYDKKFWKMSLTKKLGLFFLDKLPFLLNLGQKIINNDFLLYHLLYIFFPQKARRREIIEYEMKQWRVMPIRIWFETMKETLGVNFAKEKKKIKIPTLIFNSQKDQYFKKEETLTGLKKLCPNSKIFLLPFPEHVPKGELTLASLLPFEPFLEKL